MPVITTSNCCFILKFIAQLNLAGLQQISTTIFSANNSAISQLSSTHFVIPKKE